MRVGGMASGLDEKDIADKGSEANPTAFVFANASLIHKEDVFPAVL